MISYTIGKGTKAKKGKIIMGLFNNEPLVIAHKTGISRDDKQTQMLFSINS
jgi:hypothetical protein